MPGRLLSVVLSVLRQIGEKAAVEGAADTLVQDALKRRESPDLPVRYAVLLATADWCESDPSLPQSVREALRKSLCYGVPVIGGSMKKLFCSQGDAGFFDHGVILALFCTNDLWATVECLENPYDADGQPDIRRLKKFAEGLEKNAPVRLGASAERYLFGILPGFLPDGCGGRMHHDTELYYQILNAFGHRYSLLGASATNGPMTTGYQFANDRCMRNGLVLALVESDLAGGNAMEHGFEPIPGKRVSADKLKFAGDADLSYDVEQLDGMDAALRIQQLREELGLRESENPVLALRSGGDFRILSLIDPPARGTVRVMRRIALRDCFYVMDRKPERRALADVLIAALDGAVSNSRGSPRDLGILLVFVCTGLYKYYSERGMEWERVGRWLADLHQEIPPAFFGGLCAGEFGESRISGAQANNMSLWVRCLLDSYSPRARTRALQRRLMQAAATLLACDSPASVMQTALNQAVGAGAEGGQICLVDKQIGLILGEGFGFGYATPVSRLGHDWKAAAKITNRPAPTVAGGDFPRELDDSSILVVAIPPGARAVHPEDEDILTLITRTLRAIFVPDATKPKFRCDPKGFRVSRVRVQLAIPLVGSQLGAIGTFQISFPDGTLLDRESFALWVNYAQTIASTLEREQEREERRIREDILTLGNAILREPFSPSQSHYEWCARYLKDVGKRLGADYTHMRLRRDEEFHLVGAAPEGGLTELRRRTRPVTRLGVAGTPNQAALQTDGCVYNTAEEIKRFHEQVCAIENKELGKALKDEAAKIRSTAYRTLFDQDRLIGYWVIDSVRKYFFTERQVRIVDAVGRFLGTMVRVKEADYYRARLREYRERMEGASRGGSSDDWLERILKLLCDFTQADWGALFVWCQPPGKLVLRTSRKWHKRMEGQANYDLGEGWTGRLAQSDGDIRTLSAGDPATLDKYRDCIEPPQWRREAGSRTPRIGLKLTAGDSLVGVVTLGYYHAHASRLAATDESTLAVLRDAGRAIALSVTAAKDKAERERSEQLHTTKERVATLLISEAESEGRWQSVIDGLRLGFPVDQVSFHLVGKRGIEHGWRSPAASSGSGAQPIDPADYPELRRLAESMPADSATVLISDPKDPRWGLWPARERVQGCFAAPVFSVEGRVCGVLEFLSRKPRRSFFDPFFDDIEKRAAWDVAQILGAAISTRDYNRELDELQNRLGTAARIAATGLFSAHVMHELMNPFVRIQRAIDLLRATRGKECERHYRTIEAQKDRAVAIIERVRSGGVPGPRIEDLRNIVRDAMRVIEPAIPVPGVKLRLSNEAQARVLVDLMSMVSALVNLLNNALEAMSGTGILTVTTECKPGGKRAFVKIYNSGRHLSAEEIRRIGHLGWSSKGNRHFGLGVALAKQSIEEFGGTLRFRSPEKGGVEAVVELPTHRGAPGQAIRL
jgi:signal transduction histidine kinase